MQSLRDAAAPFEELGLEVYGVSLDDVASLGKFAEDQALTFPLLSDPDASVAKRYGVLAPGGAYAKRVTFVIDPKGILRAVDDAVSVRTHGTDLADRVVELMESE